MSSFKSHYVINLVLTTLNNSTMLFLRCTYKNVGIFSGFRSALGCFNLFIYYDAIYGDLELIAEMGALLSRWKKTQTTVEILEQIDKDIGKLEKFKRSNHELRSRVIGSLLLYSVFIFLIGCVLLYFFFTPETIFERFLQILPILCFPAAIYLLKRFLHWWFVRKNRGNDVQLGELREQRKEILENVMETETYKKAKEILEKFDPETKKKLEEERNRSENPIPQTPATGLRRRNPPNQTPGVRQMSPLGVPGTPAMSPNVAMNHGVMATPIYPSNGAPRAGRPPVMLPRPLLNQDRTAIDKFLEYLTGDGPSNRYALICKNCYSHNGMALREEFEYIEYRCGYCRFFNQAKKQRPNAPRLPSLPPTPAPSVSDSTPKAADDVSEREDSPASSKCSQADPQERASTPIQPITELVAPQAKQLEFDSGDDVTPDDTDQADVKPGDEDRPPEEPDQSGSEQSTLSPVKVTS